MESYLPLPPTHPHHPFSVRFSLAGPSLIHPRVAAAVPLAPCTFFLPVLCAILRVAHFPGTNARSLTPPPPPPAIPLNTTPQVSPSYNMSVHRICVGGRPYSDVPPCVCGRECVCSRVGGRGGGTYCKKFPKFHFLFHFWFVVATFARRTFLSCVLIK